MKSILLLAITVFFLYTVPANAYCPPYFARIDSITPQYDCLEISDKGNYCGGTVEIYNHCEGDFYFYDDTGNLSKTVLLTNYEKMNGNSTTQNLGMPNAVFITGYSYRKEPGVGYGNPNWNETLSDDAVVKNWQIKLYSIANNEDIIVTGRTIYEKPLNVRGILAIITKSLVVLDIIIFIIITARKYIWRKKVNLTPFWLLVWVTISLLFYYAISDYFFS